MTADDTAGVTPAVAAERLALRTAGCVTVSAHLALASAAPPGAPAAGVLVAASVIGAISWSIAPVSPRSAAWRWLKWSLALALLVGTCLNVDDSLSCQRSSAPAAATTVTEFQIAVSHPQGYGAAESNRGAPVGCWRSDQLFDRLPRSRGAIARPYPSGCAVSG